MKLLKVSEKESVKLVPIGDVHLGSTEFDSVLFSKIIGDVRKTKNARVILMGDLIDAALRDSVGAGTFDNVLTPEQQIETIVKLLKPIKNKIWCSLEGNHENRIQQKTSIDVAKLISKELGVPYCQDSCFIKAKIGKVNYVIYATHGSSGSISVAGKIGTLQKIGSYIDADLVLMGHVHEVLHLSQDYYKVDLKNKIVTQEVKNFAVTGHFLKYGGYAQQKNLFPGKAGVLNVFLDSTKKNIDIKIKSKK